MRQRCRGYCLIGLFVNFERELDLLSGLRKQNSDLIEVISEELTSGTPQVILNVSLGGFERIAKTESAVAVSRKRLYDIRKAKLTSDQIDDLMDETERKVAEEIEKLSKAQGTTPPPTGNQTSSGTQLLDVSPSNQMGVNDFMNAVSLLGRVVRNSEFTDVAEKLGAARLYFQCVIKFGLLLIEASSGIAESLSKDTNG